MLKPSKTQFPGVHTAILGLTYYSPTLGRFINKDPIEEQGGLNLYGFCFNNAVNAWDVLGMGVDGAGLYDIHQLDGGGGRDNLGFDSSGGQSAPVLENPGSNRALQDAIRELQANGASYHTAYSTAAQIVTRGFAATVEANGGQVVTGNTSQFKLSEGEIVYGENVNGKAVSIQLPKFSVTNKGNTAVPGNLIRPEQASSLSHIANRDALTYFQWGLGSAGLVTNHGDLTHNDFFWRQANGTWRTVTQQTQKNYLFRRSYDLAGQRAAGAKVAGKFLGGAGILVTFGQAYQEGGFTVQTGADAIFGGITFVPMVGWAISGTYSLANLVYDTFTPPLPPPKRRP